MRMLIFTLVFLSTLTAAAQSSQRRNNFTSTAGSDELTLSPNPASDNLIVTAKANTELYIFNVLGNKIATVKAEDTETSIAVANFPNGVYVLKTSDGQSGRFVVKH